MKQILIAITLAAVLIGCEGKQGPVGPLGPQGPQGSTATIYEGICPNYWPGVMSISVPEERSEPDYVLAYVGFGDNHTWVSAEVLYYIHPYGQLVVQINADQNIDGWPYKIVVVRNNP